MREDIRDKLLNIFYILFISIFIFVVWTAIFNSVDLFYRMSPIINIILSLIFFIFLYLAYVTLKKLAKDKLKRVKIISFGVLISLQIIFLFFFLVNPGWDFGIVTRNAKQLALYGEKLPVYFYNSYPNNIPITLVLSYIFKAVALFTKNNNILMEVGYIINLLLINLAVYILYKLVKETISEVMSALTIIFCIFVTPLYTYSQIIYTDTFSMIFPIGMFYYFYKYLNSNDEKRNIYLVLVSVFGGIGSIIKSNVIIAFIAIIIFQFISSSKTSKIKIFTLLLIPFLIITTINRVIVSRNIPIPYNEAGLPATHWIMMGLKGNGGYNEEDVTFTKSIRVSDGKEAAEKANLKEIKNRLKNYGLKGYCKFLIGKISFTWGDGSYYAPAILSDKPISHNKLQEFVIGNKNDGFIYFSQVSHIVILVSILISGIFAFKKREVLINSFHICILGLILFLILWETRSRYLICMLPEMIYSAIYGMENLFKLIDKKRCALKK